jgi:uncharacterized Rossmann fold enzyme
MASFQRDINQQALTAKVATGAVVTATAVPVDVDLIATDGVKQYAGGIYVGGTGNLVVVMAGESNLANTITFNNVPSGMFLPIQVRCIKSTSTCSNIICLF